MALAATRRELESVRPLSLRNAVLLLNWNCCGFCFCCSSCWQQRQLKGPAARTTASGEFYPLEFGGKPCWASARFATEQRMYMQPMRCSGCIAARAMRSWWCHCWTHTQRVQNGSTCSIDLVAAAAADAKVAALLPLQQQQVCSWPAVAVDYGAAATVTTASIEVYPPGARWQTVWDIPHGLPPNARGINISGCILLVLPEL